MKKIKKLTLILSSLLLLNITTASASTLNYGDSFNKSDTSSDYKFSSKYLLSSNNDNRLLSNRSSVNVLNNSNTLASSRAIIGNDDRYRISDTTVYPYSAITFLEITFPNGRKVNGTGFMISSDTVVTAGHCVYDKNNGGFAKSIEVVPGKNGDDAPFGTFYSTSISALDKWIKNSSIFYDLGVIKINGDVGNEIGWFNLPENIPFLIDLNVSVAGYPIDKDSHTLWQDNGSISIDTGTRVRYPIDTVGGQSGSPVFSGDSTSGYTVHAVHAYGGSSSNAGTKITPSTIKFLKDFMDN